MILRSWGWTFHGVSHETGGVEQGRTGWTAKVLCVLFWAALAFPASASKTLGAVHDLHTKAIAAARRGDFVPALEILQQLRRQDPANRRFLYDHVLVLSWAGDDQKALDLAPLIERAAAPVEVLEALAKAARNRQRFDEARSLYRSAIRRQPGRLEAAIGLGLTLADARLPDQAMELFKGLIKSHGEDPEILFGYAYAAEAKRDFLEALWAYDRVLERVPQDPRALRLKILAVANLGAPHLALDLAMQHPGTLNAGELERLEGDRMAIQTRWGGFPAATPRARFEETDRALAMMDQAYRGDWSRMDLSVPKHQRLAFDRMVALRDRVRMNEVLKLYQHLLAAQIQVPDYALTAAGDAYLYEEEPEKALGIYRDVAGRNPNDFNTRLALFYAYVELDDFTRALEVIDELAAQQAPWLAAGRQRRPNPKKQIAEIATAYGRALADDLSGAQERFESMLLIAPENTEVRKELATVYRWRGWAERALPEFEYVRRREPDYVDNRVQLATTQLALGLYPEAEQNTQALAQQYPENKHAQRLAREWQIHERPELLVNTRGAQANGAELGTSEVRNEAYLYSRPLSHYFRALLHDHFAQAEFAEGTASDHRIGAGVEYRRHRLLLSGEIYGGTNDEEAIGFAVQGSWRFSDPLRLTALAELHSFETPLRAIGNGISAHRYEIGADYIWHESQQARLGYDFFDFDDGNLRHAFLGSFRRRVLNWPHYKLTAGLDLYGSTNRKSNVIYYSPRHDFSWAVSLDNDWRLYRRYELSLAHRLLATAGRYHEEDFIPGTTWSLAYEHHWQFSQAFKLVYGVARSRRFFDGAPEFETAGYASIVLRF